MYGSTIHIIIIIIIIINFVQIKIHDAQQRANDET